jgi:hypothetical protein
MAAEMLQVDARRLGRPPIGVVPHSGQAVQCRIGAFVGSLHRFWERSVLLWKHEYGRGFALVFVLLQIAGARGPDLRVRISNLDMRKCVLNDPRGKQTVFETTNVAQKLRGNLLGRA